jgi:hypothetical protein
MATNDLLEHPIVWVVLILVFAGIFGSIGFTILGEVSEVTEESAIYLTSECEVYNVTEIGEESEEEQDCGLDGSDFKNTIYYTEFTEYNCSVPVYASIHEYEWEDPCDCGCEDAVYKVYASWYEEEPPDYETECNFSVAEYPNWYIEEIEGEYECDCGCPEFPWIVAWGIYDDPLAEPAPTLLYTFCTNEVGYMDVINDTVYFYTDCDYERYNFTECHYENVTGYEVTETLCSEEEYPGGDCGCNENDSWFEDFSVMMNITICDEWDEEPCGACAELGSHNETICVDMDYTYIFEDDENCSLDIYTECTPDDIYHSEIICYNESNWPETPPWETEEYWFYSNCTEEYTTVIAYDEYDCTDEGEGDCIFNASEISTWGQSYTDVVGGLGSGFSLYSLIPLMTIISIVIGLLVGAFYFKKND